MIKYRPKSHLLISLGLFWGGLIRLAQAAPSPEAVVAAEMVNQTSGHFLHALLFLPSGLLTAALLLEAFAQWKNNREIEPAILFLLFSAAGAAVAVVGIALGFSPVGRQGGELNSFCIWMGAVAVLASIAFGLKRLARNKKLFSLNLDRSLIGQATNVRTSGDKIIIIGFRFASIIALLASLMGVTELPLNQPATPPLRVSTVTFLKKLRLARLESAAKAEAVAQKVQPPAAAPTTQKTTEKTSSLAEALTPEKSQAIGADSLTASVQQSIDASFQAKKDNSTSTSDTSHDETKPETKADVVAPSKPSSGMADQLTASTSGTVPVIKKNPKLPRDFFQTKIKPIIDSKCVSCHGSTKVKGNLRLDTIEYFRKGSDGHPAVIAFQSELSPVFLRIISNDDDEMMPPPDKGGPLSTAQIELIKQWIDAGADFGDGPAPVSPDAVSFARRPGGRLEEMRSARLSLPDSATVESLTTRGVIIRPLTANGALIDVDFSHSEFQEIDLNVILPIAQNIYSLDLSGRQLVISSLPLLAHCKNLTRLMLQKNHSINDETLTHLTPLTELEVLNLYSTKISDEGLAKIAPLRKLRKVYFFETGVTPSGADKLRRANPSLIINLGT